MGLHHENADIVRAAQALLNTGYSPEFVAKALGKSPRTLRDWVEKGILKTGLDAERGLGHFREDLEDWYEHLRDDINHPSEERKRYPSKDQLAVLKGLREEITALKTWGVTFTDRVDIAGEISQHIQEHHPEHNKTFQEILTHWLKELEAKKQAG